MSEIWQNALLSLSDDKTVTSFVFPQKLLLLFWVLIIIIIIIIIIVHY